MNHSPAIRASHLEYHYGRRQALADLSLEVARGEIFAFLGPNGGGKTTLFRLLSTLIPLERGELEILSFDLRTQSAAVRGAIGVVFQAPSLDKKLTVRENIRHQGHLYGISGATLRQREAEMLERLGLAERASERVETLSGGLRRRVELAKGMIHHPMLLLLDEPSTGLDPGARGDLWSYLRTLSNEQGVTVVLTTHLLEEADKADRIAILHQGRLVAEGAPDALRATLGGDSITVHSSDPARLAAAIAAQFGCQARILDGCVRLEQSDGHQWIARLVEAFPGQIESVTFGKPTLEDVFIARTGHRFWQAAAEVGRAEVGRAEVSPAAAAR
ncbi:MAG TPA: ABC transporter ATP-binding protein [Pirellulales bacterium]|jgi:ABC-2 type transport system ATP-binding protein|nr:ABC transporter ATP-binding protein [Pirellulales bacterium]